MDFCTHFSGKKNVPFSKSREMRDGLEQDTGLLQTSGINWLTTEYKLYVPTKRLSSWGLQRLTHQPKSMLGLCLGALHMCSSCLHVGLLTIRAGLSLTLLSALGCLCPEKFFFLLMFFAIKNQFGRLAANSGMSHIGDICCQGNHIPSQNPLPTLTCKQVTSQP